MIPTKLRAAALALLSISAYSIGQARYVEAIPSAGSFAIARAKAAAAIYVDAHDHAGVVRAAGDLRDDVGHVTGATPALVHEEKGLGANAILVGAIGKSPPIGRLIGEGKLAARAIAGKWASFLLQVVAKPFPGVANALVIDGSGKRGTIYGIYDLSEQMGVSPWYWWADVPVRHQDALFVKAGRYVQGPPAIKYRGIFLNDEAPSLSGWVKEKFGNYNHQFYEKVFDLVLRMKGNYLWPAMWGSAVNEDDPLNPQFAAAFLPRDDDHGPARAGRPARGRAAPGRPRRPAHHTPLTTAGRKRSRGIYCRADFDLKPPLGIGNSVKSALALFIRPSR